MIDHHQAFRVVGGKAVHFVCGDMEAGVLHLEWFEEAIFEEIAKALAGSFLYQSAKHIGGDAVDPTFPWMIEERKFT